MTDTQAFNNVWGDVHEFEFAVENGATIESITIATEVEIGFVPEAIGTDLEYKIGLTKVKDIVAEPAIPADPEDDDAILANIEDEFGGERIDSDDIASFRKGNKYVTFSGTKNNWSTYTINLTSIVDDKLESGKTYYLAIDTRSSVLSSIQPAWRFYGTNTTQLNQDVVFEGTKVDRGNLNNYDSTSDWTTLVREYTPGKTNYTVLCSTSTNGVYPIDIDNIRVYAAGEEDNPVYINTFNDIPVGTVADSGNMLAGCGISGSKDLSNSAKNATLNKHPETLAAFQTNTKLEVVQEEPYYEMTVVNGTAASVDPVYTDGTTELAAGQYVLTAKLRDTKFYHNQKVPSLAEVYTLGTDGKTITDEIKGDVPFNIVCTGENGAATEADIYDLSDLNQTFTYTNIDNNNYKAENGYNYSSTFTAVTYVNNNYFNIKAVATTTDGSVESGTVKVDNTWTDAEFIFNIPEDTTLESIKFIVDSPVEGQSVMSGKTLTLGMKDVDLSYVGETVDEAVEAAIEAIDKIETVEYTDDCLALIKAAEAACADLTEDQLAKVTNYSKLTAAREGYDELKTVAENNSKIQNVIDLIDAIDIENPETVTTAREAYDALDDDLKDGVANYESLLQAEKALEPEVDADVTAFINAVAAIGTVTLDSGDAINNAKTLYDALTTEQKEAAAAAKATLDTAEATYNDLVAADAQATADAKAFDEAVEAIGEVTLDDETAITNTRAMYTNLSDAAKAKVTKLDALVAAETDLAALKQAEADKQAAKAVVDAIAAIGEVTLEDEDAIVAARAAYNKLTDAQKTLVTNEADLTAAEIALEELKNAPEEGQVLSNIENRMGGTLINSTNDASYIEGNTYMTQYGRKNNWDGFTVKLPAVDLDSTKEYVFSYKVRPSVAALDTSALQWRVPAVGTYHSNATGNYSGNNVWTTITLPFTADNVALTYRILGGSGNEYQVYPIDVDDIMIYEKNNTSNVLYKIDFSGTDVPENIAIATGYDATIISRGDDYPINTLEVQVDEAYYELSGTGSVDAKFTDGETILEPGVYTITAKLRNETFGHEGTTSWAKDGTVQHGKYTTWYPSTYYSSSLGYPPVDPAEYQGMVMENNNILNVTATIGLESGNVADATGIAVPNNWVDYTFEFKVFEETKLSDITLKATHIVAGEPVTLGMKDIDLEKTGDIVDSGITTDVGLKVVVEDESVTENDTITAKIYAIAGTYPVDISSLTFTLDYSEILTLTALESPLGDGSAANVDTGSVAWFYDIDSEADYIAVDDDVLVATATFKIASIDADTDVTIGFKADSATTPLNYTVVSDSDDPTYVGYVPGVISDTVEVTDVLPVYDITITAGEHGSVDVNTVEDVTKGTAITVSENTITIGEGDNAVVITATAEDYYEFDEWTGIADSVQADMTITASFKAIDYTVTKPESVTGNDTANHGTDYTFTVTADGSYTVFVTIGDADKVAYTAVAGTYTIAGADIVADIEITVEYAVYRTVKVVAGDDKVKFNERSFNVLDGEKLSADDVAAIESAIEAAEYTVGYELDGYKVKDGDAYVAADLGAAISADTTIYVFTKAIEYDFTAPEGMTATVNGAALTGKVTVEDTIELTADESETTIILDVTAGGVSIKDADGKYIVPASAIVNETAVETVTVNYKLITDDVYKALVAETQILVIEGTLGENGYAFDGVALYYDSELEGYATVITDDDAATSLTIAAKLTETDVKAESIAHNGDVNGDGKINSTDALYVSTMLHNPENVIFTTRMRLEANNYGNDTVVTTTDAAWILQQWING